MMLRKSKQMLPRQAARAAGLRYFRAGPCRHGHDVDRRVSDGKCLGCIRAKNDRQRRAAGAPYRGPRSGRNRDIRALPRRHPTVRKAQLARLLSEGAASRLVNITGADVPSRVYVMAAGPYVKIGVSGDVAKRVGEVQNGCPLPVVLAYATDELPRRTALWLEKVAHRWFGDRRAAGEWFEMPAADVVKVLDALMVFE